MINPLTQAQNFLKNSGCYRCPHFEFRRQALPNPAKGCCGEQKGDQLTPICGLTNQGCPGLPQCPRLDIQTKSTKIKQWTTDMQQKRSPNPVEYINDRVK